MAQKFLDIADCLLRVCDSLKKCLGQIVTVRWNVGLTRRVMLIHAVLAHLRIS